LYRKLSSEGSRLSDKLLVDEKYLLLRKTLSARKTFFNDIRALMRYILFKNWDHLIDFMIEGLELTVPP